MKEKNELLIDLEELSALQMDSINGFKQLIERIEEPLLQDFLKKGEEQSMLLWMEINAEIIALQGEIKTKGTLKGAVNHLWMKLKTDILHSDLEKVLENIKICEEFNISRYKTVLQDKPPELLALKLQKHLQMLSARLSDLILLQEKLAS